jgi:cytochrome P450
VTIPATIPRSDVDLFADDALDDPYPHLRTLRDAGPVVWLDAHGMYAATRSPTSGGSSPTTRRSCRVRASR